jgi:hypothetical protein
MIQAAAKLRSAHAPSGWARFVHFVRANDSFLALLIGAWLATFSIFLMDDFRAASAKLSAWNVVQFEMQTNANSISTMAPAIRQLASSQSGYKEGQLGIPEPFMVRGDDMIFNKSLVNLLGGDSGPLLNYYTAATNFNRERDAFLDFLNTGPTIRPQSIFYRRVQGFYVTFRDIMTRIEVAQSAAQKVVDRNRRRAERNNVFKSVFFFGMLIAAAAVSIIYLFVRRAAAPPPWSEDGELP